MITEITTGPTFTHLLPPPSPFSPFFCQSFRRRKFSLCNSSWRRPWTSFCSHVKGGTNQLTPFLHISPLPYPLPLILIGSSARVCLLSSRTPNNSFPSFCPMSNNPSPFSQPHPNPFFPRQSFTDRALTDRALK